MKQDEDDVISSPEIEFDDVSEIREYGTKRKIEIMSSPEIEFDDVSEIREYGIMRKEGGSAIDGHISDLSGSDIEEQFRGKRKRKHQEKTEERKHRDKLYQRNKRQVVAQKKIEEQKITLLEEKVRVLESKVEAQVELIRDERRQKYNKKKRETRKFDKVTKQRDEKLLQNIKLNEILNGDGCVLLGSRDDQLQFLQEKLNYDGSCLNGQDLACKVAAVQIIFKNAPNIKRKKFIVHYNDTIFRYLFIFLCIANIQFN
jgi:hypothetical protein